MIHISITCLLTLTRSRALGDKISFRCRFASSDWSGCFIQGRHSRDDRIHHRKIPSAFSRLKPRSKRGTQWTYCSHYIAVSPAHITQIALTNKIFLYGFREKLDTPENREANPKADFSKWPSPDKVAGLLKMWADGENRPETGSFAKLQMSQGSVITELL